MQTRPIRIILIVVLLMSLFHTTVMAQDKVLLSGKVTDTFGNPLPEVIVAIESRTNGSYTDENGLYKLEILPGNYLIIVSLFGYEIQKSEIEIQKNMTLDFTLKESITNLNTVEIYGKSKAQQLREGAFSVNAIKLTSQQNTSAGLNTLINRTSSVRLREDGGLGSDFKLSINGLSGNSIRYFIDGVPLSSLGNGVTLANIPTNIVDRVEIYKGVVPPHLGADALGGVINIITKKVTRNYLDVSYGTGSFHTHKADLSGQYIHNASGFVVRPVISFNYSKNDYVMRDVEIWDPAASKYTLTDLKRFHDDYASFLGQLEVGFVNRSWADAFLLSGSYSVEDKDIQSGNIQTFVYGKAHSESEAWSIAAQYRKDAFFLEKLKTDLTVSYTRDHSVTTDTAYRKYFWDGSYAETYRNEIYQRGKSIRHYIRPLTVVRTNFNYTINPNHRINFNYLLNSLTNKRTEEIDETFEPTNDLLTKHILAASYMQSLLEDQWANTFFLKHYINRLIVRQTDNASKTGSKEMNGSSTINYTGYGIGSRFTLRDELALKASYEHSIRLPSAMELLGNGVRIYPNFKLNPEHSNNFNLGVFGSWRLTLNHWLFYETTVFVREVKDYIYIGVDEKDGLSQYQNVDDVTVKGVEGEIRYEYADMFQAIVNCSYQEARNKAKLNVLGQPNSFYNNKIPNQPWFFSNAELNLKLKNLLGKETLVRFAYNYQYTHWFFLTWEGYGKLDTKSIIPTQHVHNANVTCSFRNEQYNITMECNNLLDSKLYDNFMLQKPGRSFFVKFRFFIN